MATLVKKTMRDGSNRWMAFIRRGGVVKKKTHRTRAAAERWARATEAQIDDGRDLPPVEDERRTVSAALDAYIESGALSGLRSPRQRYQHVAWWRERIGGERLRDLKRETIRTGLARLEAGDTPSGRPVSPATRRRYLATLRACLTWCVDQDWIQSNPASGAARKGIDVEPPGRTRFLSDEERRRLLETANHDVNPRIGPLARLALLTGMRQGELLGLRWSDVDLDRGLASLQQTKGGTGRAVALAPAAVAILRELHGRRVVGWRHVFASPPAGKSTFPRDAWERALQDAEIADFRFHDLRHSFASYLLSAGATLPELAAALGHRTLAMVQRYAHLERAHAHRVVAKVAERIESDGK